MTVSLEQLPDFPALRQVQEALWGLRETRGAAVMVGAGFSRFAELPAATSLEPPLWSDFAREMAARLYPAGGAPTNPLRLAEEYGTSLGRHALDALIRNLVRDDQLQPGPLHSRLLGLPWADVLTTNWDTLLERTSVPDVDISYDVVRVAEDIARTRAPRIVKLHGSLPSHGPFIFTEEDFRTYPRLFAPFVNLAQQVLLENELCLLGFSGDDPNFLEWSGWVRDHLGRSARRIRLVGVLNLSVSRRQVLEHHNVSPIDLAPLVSDLDPSIRHRRATEIFLDSLLGAKPKPLHVWIHRDRPTTNAHSPVVDFNSWTKQLVAEWRAERESYPGWLVAPVGERYRLRYDPGADRREVQANTAKASVENQNHFARELVWRYETALLALEPWIEERAEAAITTGREYLSDDERCELALALLRQARRRRDWEKFDRLASQLDASIAQGRQVELIYERALRARDQMDFEALAGLVNAITGDDPAWSIRRASLLSELGEPRRAAETLLAALEDIRSRRARDRTSIWLLSREAWAAWLMDRSWFELPKDKRRTRTDLDRWPVKYKAADCDPWDQIQHLDYELNEAAKRRIEESTSILPRFDAGTYQDKSTGRRWNGGGYTTPLQELNALAEKVGLPRQLGHMDVIGLHLVRALEVERERSAINVWLAARSLRKSKDELIDLYFSRIEISRLPLAIVVELSNQLRKAIDYGRKQVAGEINAEWLSQIMHCMELLSRLSVRLEPSEALQIFRWGIALARDQMWSHWWLFEPLDHLLTRTLEAVPPALHTEVALEALEFPIPDEKDLKAQPTEWPELSLTLKPAAFAKRKNDYAWNHRIAALIEHVRTGSPSTRAPATWRLLRLHEAKTLTVDEQSAFASALWSRRAPDDGLPEDTQLYGHVFLALPEPEPGLASRVFERVVVEFLAAGSINEFALFSLAESGARSSHGEKFPLSEASANRVLNACLLWAPRQITDDDELFGHIRYENDKIERALSRCLASAVLPALRSGNLQDKQVQRLTEIVSDKSRPSTLQAATEFARLAPDLRAQILSLVRRGLASGNESTVNSAITAVNRFIEARDEFPAVLATDITSMCAVRREPGLLQALWSARKLIVAGLLPTVEQDRVIEGLEFLLTETSYENWDSRDPRTRSLSLVRRQCVRLAHVLRMAGREPPTVVEWLSATASDPVPEVRFALFDLEQDD
jgi:hypothetical protein